MPIVISGLTADSKTPGAVSDVEYGAGFSSTGSNPRKVLLYGLKSSAGSAAANSITPVFTETAGRTLAGARSEGARMIAAALAVPGAKVLYAPTAEAGGAAAASLDVVIGGTTAAAGGSFDLHFGDASKGTGVNVVQVGVVQGEAPTAIGDRLESLVDAISTLYCTATNTTGTVALDVVSAGERGNAHNVFLDTSKLPSGITVVLSGGTALANGAVPFTGGSGVETMTGPLAAAEPGKFDYVGAANIDATSIGLLIAQANSKAGPLKGRPENLVVASVATLAAATTLVQTNMNEALGNMVWYEGARNHPSEIAAQWAAYRSVTEAQAATPLGDPNHRYDGEQLPTIAGYYDETHVPGRSVTDAALNVGLTPIGDKNGKATIVRAITSRSLNGSDPDYRTLDLGDAVVPQRIREHFDAKWETEHAVANPYVGPDLPNGEAPPVGMSTPGTWGASIYGDMVDFQAANLVTDLPNNLPEVEWDGAGKRLMASIPCKVTPQNHQVGNVIRQIPS